MTNKRSFFYLFSVLILCVFLSRANAQYDFKFRYITKDQQKLSQNNVECILQDKFGFMWFGTGNGLNKYDGYNVVEYKTSSKDVNTIPNNLVLCLMEDSGGKLWIGTSGGLCYYDQVVSKFVRVNIVAEAERGMRLYVRCINEDKDKKLWIGTNKGLYLFDPQRSVLIKKYVNVQTDSTSLPNDEINCLYIDTKERLWIGTAGFSGLTLFDRNKQKFKSYKTMDFEIRSTNKLHLNINAIHEDKYGKLWLGCSGAVKCFDPRIMEYVFYEPFLSERNGNKVAMNVSSVAVLNDTVMCFGMLGYGLKFYDINTSHNIRSIVFNEAGSGLNNGNVQDIFIDRQKNIWIATDGGGVNFTYVTNQRIKLYNQTIVKDFHVDDVMALMEDQSRTIWVGTNGGGVYTFDRSRIEIKHYNEISRTLKNNNILSLLEDRNGQIWIGSWGGGVCSYNKTSKKVRAYPEMNLPADATIISLLEDSEGMIWVASYDDGIYVYDPFQKTVVKYTINNGLSSNKVNCLSIDSKKNIWIGTQDGGVCVYNRNTKKFNVYKKNENDEASISSNNVNCVYEDIKKQMIWLATDAGITSLDLATGKFVNYEKKQGLPDNYVYGILPDQQGNLWLSTDKGISCFNPNVSTLTERAFRNYDISDGLQGMEFNQGAFHIARDGELFFGGLRGFNCFYPDQVSGNVHIPDVYITSYIRSRKQGQVPLDSSIFIKHEIEVNHKDNSFYFEFVALDYQSPSQNLYSFKMEGVDKDWSPPSTERKADYPYFGPGEYTLKVKACNNDGVWNEEGVAVNITVNPPWYLTTWAKANYVIVGLIMLIGFPQYRNYRITRENKILERKVADRTRQLAEKNADITSSIEYAKRIQEAILPTREEILKHLPHSFILYKPRDIVSGDFYWFGVKNKFKIIAVVDCTGHGVPGAFMSMIGHNLLNQIVNENDISQPDKILNELHKGIQLALKQGTGQTTDGMDVALCAISDDGKKLFYSGANRPLYIVRNKTIERIVADKHPVGGAQVSSTHAFKLHEFDLLKGDTIYMFSDGYADQFGGEHGKKFMVKQLNHLLINLADQPIEAQENQLATIFDEWKADLQQVDDVLVVGIRV